MTFRNNGKSNLALGGIDIPPELNPAVYCPACGWSGVLLECPVITDALATCPLCSAAVETVDRPTVIE